MPRDAKQQHRHCLRKPFAYDPCDDEVLIDPTGFAFASPREHRNVFNIIVYCVGGVSFFATTEVEESFGRVLIV